MEKQIFEEYEYGPAAVVLVILCYSFPKVMHQPYYLVILIFFLATLWPLYIYLSVSSKCIIITNQLVFEYIFYRKKVFDLSKIHKVAMRGYRGKHTSNLLYLWDEHGKSTVAFAGTTKTYCQLKETLEELGFSVTEL